MQSIGGSNMMMHPSLASIGQYGGQMTPLPSFTGSLSQHPTSSAAVDAQSHVGVGGTMARTSSTLSKASATGKKVKVKQADGTYKIMVVGADGRAHPIRGASSEPLSRSPSAGGLGASGTETPNATTARSPTAATRKMVKCPPSPSAAGLFPIANLPPPSPTPQQQQQQQPYISTPFQHSQTYPTMLIPASQAGLSWRERFARFYQQHAPDKMEKVETCMTMEAGPQAVMDALEKKYGPEPPVLVPAPNLAASATHVPPLYGQQNVSTGVQPYPLLPAPVSSGAATPDPRASSVTSRSPSVATTTRIVRKLVKKAAPKPSAAKMSEAPPPASRGANTNENLPPMENLEDVLGAKESAVTTPRPAAAATKKKKAESAGQNTKPKGAASRALGALLQNLKASSSDSDSDSVSDRDDRVAKGGDEGEGPPLAADTVSPRTTAPTEGPATLAKIALASPAQIKRSRSSDSDSSEEGAAAAGNDNGGKGNERDLRQGVEKEVNQSDKQRTNALSVSPPSSPSVKIASGGAVPTLTVTENGWSGGEKLKASPKSLQSHPPAPSLPSKQNSSESNSEGEAAEHISSAGDTQSNKNKEQSTTPLNDNGKVMGKPPSSAIAMGSGRQVVEDAKKMSAFANSSSSSSSSSMDGVSATARAALASTPTRRPTVNNETVVSHREHYSRIGESSTSLAPIDKKPAAGSLASDRYHGGNSEAGHRHQHQKTVGASSSRPHEGPPLSSIRASTPPRGRNALAQQSGAATTSSAAAARERLQKSPGPTPWPLRSYTPDRSRLAHGNADNNNNHNNNNTHSGAGHSTSLNRQGSTSRVPSVAPSANATPMRGGGEGGSVSRRRPPPAVRDAPHIKIVDRSTFSPNIEKPPTPGELFGIKRSEVRCPVRIGPPPSSKRHTEANRDRYGSAQRRGRSEDRGGGDGGGAADELPQNGSRRNSRSNTPNGEMARRASIALGDLTYKKMRGDELSEAARALHRGMKNSKYSYFDGLSADYFSTFPSKSSPQSQRPSSWALSSSGRGNGAVIAGIQKKLLIAKKEEEQRSPSRARIGGDDSDDRAAREGRHRDSRGYDGGDASASYGHAEAVGMGDGYATQPRRLYTTSYLGRGDSSYAATRGGYTDPYGHQEESHDSHHGMNGGDLTVADLISNSRRIIRTARGLSLEDGTAEELEAFGAGGKSGGRGGGGGGAGTSAAPVGIDSMDGVDEIIFEKEIPPPPGRASSSLGGYGSTNKDSMRRRAQTIVRRDEVVCVLREIPHSSEEVRRQRELSDRLSKPRNLYVSRDVVVAGGGGSKKR